ncbi:GGDEF domain-containing phosphodiesterase [Pseudoprimorskyibacter insulae]|uniref:GGDEF domain-containing phosphodiesterase n=1 Tax=Pseudoprimorskyibacter insulae TaxID=1695997 RepID=UPI0015E86CCD|nr:GGDEF domain-containing phosphodiesterase [Pseudoprimorskyibacter insulae]
MIATALCLPLIVALNGHAPRGNRLANLPADLPVAPVQANELAGRLLSRARDDGLINGCLMIHITGMDGADLRARQRDLRERLALRVRSVVRQSDMVFWMGQDVLTVLLSPQARLTSDAALSLSRRVQAAIEEPVLLDEFSRSFSGAIGIALSTELPLTAGGVDLLHQATRNQKEASRNGRSSVRIGIASHPVQITETTEISITEASDALENGQIVPWFQPQLSTETGDVSGAEALARWVHPKRGLIAPSQFLPLLDMGGATERLGEVILSHSLAAMNQWSEQGLLIPGLSVNMSDAELRNPKLASRILWELDRQNISANRLRIEVLETVVSDGSNPACARNINTLSDAGCRIDLDDFGTGSASIAALQRLNISCLKIDRSFVCHLDRDENQRRLVAAILSMAERLGLETVAEGVESAGEHTLLAQLGCHHVQGFGIARPMPPDQIPDWIRHHQQKIDRPVWPRRNVG